MHRRMLPSVRRSPRHRRPAHDRGGRAGTRRGRSADADDARPVPHPDRARRHPRRSTWRASRSGCSRGPPPRRSPRSSTPGRATESMPGSTRRVRGSPWTRSLRESMARDRRRASGRDRAAQQPDRQHPPAACLVLPARWPAPADPRRRSALPVRPPRPDEPSRPARAGSGDGPGRHRTARRRAPRPDRGSRDGHRRRRRTTSPSSSSAGSTSRPGRRSTSSG